PASGHETAAAPPRSVMNSRRRISAPKLRGQHCIGSNGYLDRAQPGQQNHCRSAQPMSQMGQKPNPSGTVACQLSPAPPDIPAHARSAALCQLRTHAVQQTTDAVAMPYSITSLAVICMISGTVRPSALAVLRLIASSNLVGSC